MLGAISHVDTFDYKPMLVKHARRRTCRASVREHAAALDDVRRPVRVSDRRPARGRSSSTARAARGSATSCRTPAAIADELCFVKSMHTEHVNHDPASKFLHTGFQLAGRPSAGAWVSYALGSDNRDLPNFVVMNSGHVRAACRRTRRFGARVPAVAPSGRGVPRRRATPCCTSSNPDGLDRDGSARRCSTPSRSSRGCSTRCRTIPRSCRSVSQYEMAYRMQASMPEVADISDEPEHVLDMYGPDVRKPGTFARNCLLARRLAERDVKFTMLFGMGWDHHFGITAELPRLRAPTSTSRPPALVTDLKQRGLLDDTLVMFGTEFGRTSFAQGAARQTRLSAAIIMAAISRVAGGRRRQGRASPTARPTTSATTSSRTPSTSTISTRRSCTCSASITSG